MGELSEEARTRLLRFATAHPTILAELLLELPGRSSVDRKVKTEACHLAGSLDIGALGFYAPLALADLVPKSEECGRQLDLALECRMSDANHVAVLGAKADRSRALGEIEGEHAAYGAMLTIALEAKSGTDAIYWSVLERSRRIGSVARQRNDTTLRDKLSEVKAREASRHELKSLFGSRKHGMCESSLWGDDDRFHLGSSAVLPRELGTKHDGSFYLKKLACGGLLPTSIPEHLIGSVILVEVAHGRSKYLVFAVYAKHDQGVAFLSDVTTGTGWLGAGIHRVWAVVCDDSGRRVRSGIMHSSVA